MPAEFQVLHAQTISVARVAVQMSDAALPAPFVSPVLKMALQEEGFLDLVELWRDAEDQAERLEVEADLAELLDDVEQAEAIPAGPQSPPTKEEGVEQIESDRFGIEPGVSVPGNTTQANFL